MEQFRDITVAILALVLAFGAGENAVRFSQNKIPLPSNDKGQLVDCGDKKTMSSFSADWSPKDLKVGEMLTLNGQLTSEMVFTNGKACFTLWLEGVPNPMLSDCMVIKCENILKLLKPIGLEIKCPLTKGAHYEMKDFNITYKPVVAIPTGSYKIAANVTTDQGKPYLCAEGHVTLV